MPRVFSATANAASVGAQTAKLLAPTATSTMMLGCSATAAVVVAAAAAGVVVCDGSPTGADKVVEAFVVLMTCTPTFVLGVSHAAA